MKSTAGFVLALIGGIQNLIFGVITTITGILAYLKINYFVKATTNTPGLKTIPIFSTNTLLIFTIIITLWALIAGTLLIMASLKMKKEDSAIVKKGGIMALIVGILSLNLLSIIGGVIGIIQANDKQ